MTVQNKGYNRTSIFIHWLVALIIIGLFSSGYWMVELNYYSPWYKSAPFWHKSVGIVLLALMLFRVSWRGLKGAPKPLTSHSKTVQLASSMTHLALYILIFTILCSGYLISTADNRPIEVFGWFEVPSLGELFTEQADRAGLVHQFGAYSLIALAALHALAALKHHFFDKDDTLKRMLKP